METHRSVDEFFGLWFPDKVSESTKARESNQMNLDTRDIVLVHVGFRLSNIILIFSIIGVRVGVENRHSNCQFMEGTFFDITHR